MPWRSTLQRHFTLPLGIRHTLSDAGVEASHGMIPRRRLLLRNFHLPLPERTYAALRAEAERVQLPATTIAREAILIF
jgi:hypothetical protein